METSPQKPINFMYFWLNYLAKDNVERIPVAVKNIDHLFRMTTEVIEADTLNQFLFSDGTQIDENECLESLETATELIFCTEEEIQKLSIYFEVKRYLRLKNIFYPLNIDYFIYRLAALRVAAFFRITLNETRNSYFCVTPKNQVLDECTLLFFR